MDALDVGMIDEAAAAREKLSQIEEKAVARARLVLEMLGKDVSRFDNANGFSVHLKWFSFIDPKADTDFVFTVRDDQGDGSERVYQVPREPMTEDTEELLEFIEFKRLQAKFGA